MQAQPQSSPAARTHSTSRLSPLPKLPSPQSRNRALFVNKPTPPSASSLAGTTGLAHDAGNLLAALGLYCDLLSVPGVLRPEHRHYATELRLISSRSSNLIQRLIVTSEQTAHHQPDASAPLPAAIVHRPSSRSSDAATPAPDHATMLRNLAPVLQRIAAGAASVSVTCPASLPPLDFPSEIIERITVNLVRNAAEAIRIQRNSLQPSSTLPAALCPEGEIRVSLAVVGPHLQLTVEDNGPGMPPAAAAAFLHPSPLPQGASHGLGHRIVHELAATSAAQFSLRVRPGIGTIFCLKWPIPSTPPADPTHPGTSTAPEGSSTC